MALLPPVFLNSVVALGSPSNDGEMQFSATGFMYGHPTEETNDNDQMTYRLYLVTNKHVFENASGDNKLLARFNRAVGAEPSIYSIPLSESDGSTAWTVHPNADVDVAVLSASHQQLQNDIIEYYFFCGDTDVFTLEQARESEVSEGDGVFVLGFPLGQAGDERNYAVVRHGIVARIQDWLKGNSSTFLIDASIFPGNSGGPVLLKPELTSVVGTQHNDKCGLIGMVSSYLPYREVAISKQTGRPRMIFEENSGLGVVVPPNLIQETIDIARSNLSQCEPASSITVEQNS